MGNPNREAKEGLPEKRRKPRTSVLSNPLSRQIYQNIVRQLHHDGYLSAASTVADATGVIVPSVGEEGDRLTRLVATGLAGELQRDRELRRFNVEHVVERHVSAAKVYAPLYLSQHWSVGRQLVKMRNRFTSAALGGVIRDIVFSPDGSLIGCAGTNGLAAVFSLDTLEDLTAIDEVRAANRIKDLDGSGDNNNRSNTTRNANEVTELSMARQYRDHAQSVECIRFHPSRPVVLTGGRGGYLFLHEYSQPDSTPLLKIQDNYPIRSASFHPSGDYVLFATDHFVPRLTNVRTEKVMTTPGSYLHLPAASSTSATASAHHSAGLTAATFSGDGRTFCTASLDGCWTLYDGVSGKVVFKMEHAHSAVPVTSAVYSRSGQVLLTSGMDSVARLWDLRMLLSSSRFSALGAEANYSCELMSFGEPAKCDHRSFRAMFSHDESHVICQDSTLLAVHNYCVYSGDVSYTISTQPSFMQRGLAASPFSNIIVSGGDDSRLRLWTPSWLPS